MMLSRNVDALNRALLRSTPLADLLVAINRSSRGFVSRPPKPPHKLARDRPKRAPDPNSQRSKDPLFKFNSYLRHHLLSHHYRKLEPTIQTMKERGVKPVTQSYNYAFEAQLCLKEKPEKAQQLFETMQNDGVQPDAKTFQTIMKICSNKGQGALMLQWLDKMKEMQVQPSNEVYEVILDYFGKRGETQEMKKWFEDMKSVGLTPAANTFALLLHGYQGKGEAQEMLQCIEQMNSYNIPYPPVPEYSLPLFDPEKAKVREASTSESASTNA